MLVAYLCYFAPDSEWPGRLPGRIARLIPYGGIFLFYAWIRFFAMAPAAAGTPPPTGNAYTTVLSMFKVVALYLRWFILPADTHVILRADESFAARSFFTPDVIISLGFIILWVAAAVSTFRHRRMASFGLVWVAVTLLPVLNIVPLFEFAAGRYLYLPAAGFGLALAALLWSPPGMRFFSFSPQTWKTIRRDAVIILLIFYGLFTAARNSSWRSFIVFWENLAEQYPRNTMVHVRLGESYRTKGRMDRAVTEFQRALRINPANTEAHLDLGLCYLRQRKFSLAETEFRIVVSLEPRCAFAYNNLGCIRAQTGRYAESTDYFIKAIELEPGYPMWYKNLGRAYLAMQQPAKAEAAWRKARLLNPHDPDIIRDLERLEQRKAP